MLEDILLLLAVIVNFCYLISFNYLIIIKKLEDHNIFFKICCLLLVLWSCTLILLLVTRIYDMYK